jgi:DNA-binding Lrp family transcriptional regulator
MPIAYILANCMLGSEERIIKEITELPEVREVRGIYGVYDIFVEVRSDTRESLNHTITIKIRRISGITSTVTMIAIEDQAGKG